MKAPLSIVWGENQNEVNIPQLLYNELSCSTWEMTLNKSELQFFYIVYLCYYVQAITDVDSLVIQQFKATNILFICRV